MALRSCHSGPNCGWRTRCRVHPSLRFGDLERVRACSVEVLQHGLYAGAAKVCGAMRKCKGSDNGCRTICETIFESEAALRTHMCRVHDNRGVARRFVADTQCLMCKKSFVTRARAMQHGNNTKCKHAMECVWRMLRKSRCDWITRWLFFAATQDGQVSPFQLAPWPMDRHEFGLSSVAVLPCWVAASPVSPTCAFVFLLRQ